MSTNQDLIKKADMALADLATAGRLNPEQTDRFIRTLIDQPTMLQNVRTVTMNSPEMKINKIGFGSRILRPATSGVALTAAQRSKPDMGQVKLNTNEVIAEVRIPYDVIEDNIERGNVRAGATQGAGGLHQTLVDLMGERAALDLEELGIRGDTTSSDAFLALQDGWLKRSTANIVDAAGEPLSKDLFKAGVKTMPDKYLRNKSALRHFVSMDNETEMRDVYGSRATALGDAQIQGNLPLYVFGSQVSGVPLMPSQAGLFANPLNFIFGVQRNIQIEYDKDITARVFIIVLTARVAFQIEEVDAVVKYQNIAAQ